MTEPGRVDAIVILDVAGRLTLEEGVATLREQVRQQLAAGERKILVDLSSCDYIDSAGLGELATTLIRLQNAGGRFALLGAKKRVRDLLRISQLLGVFEIFDDEAQAQAVMK
jgi:anti-sigma B factor antagonist